MSDLFARRIHWSEREIAAHCYRTRGDTGVQDYLYCALVNLIYLLHAYLFIQFHISTRVRLHLFMDIYIWYLKKKNYRLDNVYSLLNMIVSLWDSSSNHRCQLGKVSRIILNLFWDEAIFVYFHSFSPANIVPCLHHIKGRICK